MTIGFVGLGKLGLPVALAVNDKHHRVLGFDVNPAIKGYLQTRAIPYTERGATELLRTHTIEWSNLAAIVRESDIIFIPIQTPHEPEFEGASRLPSGKRQDFDYTYLKSGIAAVAAEAARQQKITTVVVISTCLPGTFKQQIEPLLNTFIRYCYNPFFIAMGTTINDFLHPEFVLLGSRDVEAEFLLEEFYRTIHTRPVFKTDITTAEGIKVFYNTFITTKTVLGNLYGEMASKLGMNVDDIHTALTMADDRLISPKYLKSGVADGGGCHPRDNIALSWLAGKTGLSYNFFDALMQAREAHMAWLAGLLYKTWTNHPDLPVYVLGKSFKPETNIKTGSAALLLGDILEADYNLEFIHLDDLQAVPVDTPAIYFIATRHVHYQLLRFPKSSVVIDPFRYIREQRGVKLISIGKTPVIS